MSEAALFTLIFVGLFVLRIILATIFFALILPADGRCPNCNALTLRLTSRLDRLLPMFRRSWCLQCGWHGVLRKGTVTPEPSRAETLTRR
ncbi:MAG TPA: hypothetical protein VFZ73_13935 [Gemmatimonadaceae bacterium]